MQILRPPDSLTGVINSKKFKIYLSGDDVRTTWRSELLYDLEEVFEDKEVIILIPNLRDVDYLENMRDPHFKAKVNWEQSASQIADIIYLHFSEDSPCPQGLLEFGLYAKTKKCLISCEVGFWKRGYLETLSKLLGISFHTNTVDAWTELQNLCENHNGLNGQDETVV